MDKIKDAYGWELYDYWKGAHHVQEIVERSDGYIDVGVQGPAYYFADYIKWPDHLKQAIRHARGRVLDIGCGAGRVILYLQKKGHEVVGIDNSPLAIEVCRGRGARQAIVKSITQIGPKMRIFDTIVMFGNNFGLFSNFKRARWLLKKMHKMTSPGGRIIAETVDVYKTKLTEHLEYQRQNRQRGRMSGQIRLRIRYKKYRTDWFDYLLVSPDELKKVIKGTGWVVKKLFQTPGAASYCMLLEKEKI